MNTNYKLCLNFRNCTRLSSKSEIVKVILKKFSRLNVDLTLINVQAYYEHGVYRWSQFNNHVLATFIDRVNKVAKLVVLVNIWLNSAFQFG